MVFLFGTRLIGSFAHPFYQWWTYLLYAPPNPMVTLWLKIGAGVASAAVLVFAVALVFRRRIVGPSLRQGFFGGTPQPMRGATDNHGHADWLSIAKAREVFPGPSAEFGGIVVGEAYRVDQDRVAAVAFDPANKATWGKGGKASAAHRPLQVRPHAQPGLRRGWIVQDHVGRLHAADVDRLRGRPGSVLRAWPHAGRRARGHGPYGPPARRCAGTTGFNVLDWIDIESPLAATNVLSVVGWVCGDGQQRRRRERQGGRVFRGPRSRAGGLPAVAYAVGPGACRRS